MSRGGMESVARPPPSVGVGVGGGGGAAGQQVKERCEYYFQMPLHYSRYSKAEYEVMAEWKLDCLLRAYGLPIIGDVNHKRIFAMGAFLWPH